MSDVTLDFSGALEQSIITAEHYLSHAYKILDEEYENWTPRDAIELSKVMAADFHTTAMCIKLQEIRDAINGRP